MGGTKKAGSFVIDALRASAHAVADGVDIFGAAFDATYYRHRSGFAGCECGYCVAMRVLDSAKRRMRDADGFGSDESEELDCAAARMREILVEG